MGAMRRPFFFVALAVAALVFIAEIGSGLFGGLRGRAGLGDEAPGLGIPSLAALDGLLLFTFVLMGLPHLVGDRLHGRVQGIATLVVSILALLAAFFMVIKDLILLVVMVSLLLAAPFGTIAYLALYGTFPTGAASGMLGALLFLKLA